MKLENFAEDKTTLDQVTVGGDYEPTLFNIGGVLGNGFEFDYDIKYPSGLTVFVKAKDIK